ncbi:OsmC family protein [Rhodanobacter glycinis]|uniref:bifunctional alpha/beta hydrolase/OsmC family protein n=1 Tax=Rhodanobacter glycinis TaxID=582702 RepID=UPI00112914C4|nr:bifunctional alpha/beta hydrolase/OsmC family protein [Rhodanobacter glycinis]TPG45534.1 OsmC family protein [Rhodanobacter glycinis]
MPPRNFEFSSPAGYPLAGRLELPDAPVRGWALMAHCFTCGKDNLAAVRIGRALARAGIGMLRFDFAGLGASGGDFADSTFAANVRDLVAAHHAMSDAGMPPSLLVGHSLGGAAALAAAADMPNVRAVTTIAAPFDLSHVLALFDPASLATIEQQGEAEVRLAGRPFRVSKAFIDGLREHDQASRIATLGRPLLILHAPRDEIVDIDNASRIFMAAGYPKSLVSLDDADHLLSRQSDVDYAAAMIISWSSRYLQPVPETRAQGQEGDVVAEETGAGRFQLAIHAGGIRFLADEPVSAGGLGSGPTPYDLVSAGLAACTTMTLRMYAEYKGLPVGRIRTAVGHMRQKGVEVPDLFTRTIAIEGPLDDAQRERLLQIADRCPVDLTLLSGSRVETTFGEPPAAAEPVEAHAASMERLVTADDSSPV